VLAAGASVVTVAPLLLRRLFGRRIPGQHQPPASVEPAPATANGNAAAARPPSERRNPREKRKHPRRAGRSVPVHISAGSGKEALIVGLVTDRSREGLGITLGRPLARWAVVEVRPLDAPEDVPWVRLVVRNCRRKGRRWHAGCRFTEEQPWSTVLLFG